MTKIILTILVLILIGSGGFAQQKPKPKDKPPTQKEIDEMMREAQKEMDGLSEEEKKMMEDMGVKMPDLKNIPKFTDQQIQEVWDEENRLIPPKDNARIALVNKKVLSSAELATYLKSASSKIESRMDVNKLTAGKKAYDDAKLKYKTTNAVAVAASGYWSLGILQPAIYMMGRVCLDEPNNPDHLNNYAAFLTMARAEEVALPILYKLNKDYKRNSTILNNIGQAWFGLGDVAMAEKYLDSAIQIYPYHAQANYSKALIEESKGNKQGAINAMKRSLKSSYSKKKELKLKDLGYQVSHKDIQWIERLPQDPLGLEKFTWPAYPKSVEESKQAIKDWESFRAECQQKANALKAKLKAVEAKVASELQTRLTLAANGKDINQLWLAPKAMLKLDHLMSDQQGTRMRAVKDAESELLKAKNKVDELRIQIEKESEKVWAKCSKQGDEQNGTAHFKECCEKIMVFQDKFLNEANPILEKAYKKFLDAHQKMMTDRMYYLQFMMYPEEFEAVKLIEKAKWLDYISFAQPVQFETPNFYCSATAELKAKRTELADFNDINCQYKLSLNFGFVNYRKECDKSIIENLGVGPININLTYNDWKEEIVRGSVEIGISKTLGGISSGPVSAGIKGSLTGFVEFDNSGVTDVGVIAVAEVNAGVGVDVEVEYEGQILGMDTKVDFQHTVGRELSVGVNARMGWNSGGSVQVFNKF
jgi:tetratricopeptide (TPR) repeat protein